jgi:uncharacterized protein
MRFPIIIAALAATLLFAAPSRAEQPSPEALAAARDLVTAIKATDYLKSMLPSIIQTLKPAVVQGRPAVEKDYDAITPLMLDVFNTRLAELTDLVARVYALNFTADELRTIQAFYQTPTGQKVREKMPLVSQQSMMIGQQWGKTLSGELRARIVEELRKRGHDI